MILVYPGKLQGFFFFPLLFYLAHFRVSDYTAILIGSSTLFLGWCVNSRIIRNGHAPDDSEYLQRNGTCNSAVYSEFCKILSEGHFLSWWPETLRIQFSSNWQSFKFGKRLTTHSLMHSFIHSLNQATLLYSEPLWVNWMRYSGYEGTCDQKLL